MRSGLWLLAWFLVSAPGSHAEVDPVVTRVPNPKAWVGQRVPFFVDLRSRGTFAGTASFDLPNVPGAMVMKIGEPLVETEEFDGQKWFVQRHEFALFSQKAGPIRISAFTVRFARREGYTGPATDVEAQAAGVAFEIERPPGSEGIGFLITTESLDIEETWDPTPGPAEVGAVFKRTIVQRAPQMTGMALAPAPANAADGIRVYPGDAATSDDFYRGAFQGERRETITYLLQKPGTLEIPALTYMWWNPKTEKLRSKTLPAVTFEVAALPNPTTAEGPPTSRRYWPGLLVVIGMFGFLAWQRRRIAARAIECWTTLNPPDRVAARRLLRACGKNDSSAAEIAWNAWRITQPASYQPDPKLRATVLGMQHHRYDRESSNSWTGNDLARAFSESLADAKSRSNKVASFVLPSLNP